MNRHESVVLLKLEIVCCCEGVTLCLRFSEQNLMQDCCYEAVILKTGKVVGG